MVQKYSLVASLGSGALVFLSAYCSLHYGSDFADYSLLVIIIAFVLFLLELRSGAEILSFKDAFQKTFLIGTVVMIANSIVFYVVIKFYNRIILDMMKSQTSEMLDSMDFSAEIAATHMAKIESFGPLLYTIAFLIGYLVKNLFWCFIVATFLKKEKVEYSDEQY